MHYYISYRLDGTIRYLLTVEERIDPEKYPAEESLTEVSEEIADHLLSDLEGHIVDAGAIRDRIPAEMRVRVREIYNRVKSGELHRASNDLIERYKHFFTHEELEEVELPEQKIRRLETRLKALETRLR